MRALRGLKNKPRVVWGVLAMLSSAGAVAGAGASSWDASETIEAASPGESYVDTAARALRQWLGERYDEFDIRVESDYHPLTVPAGPVRFVAQVGAVPRAVTRMAVNVSVLAGERRVRSVPVWFHVSAFKQALLLNRDMSRHSEIPEDAVNWVRTDVARLMGAPLMEYSQLAAFRTRTPLKAGQIITRDRLEKAPEVSKGEVVLVTARTGVIELQTHAVAMDDGATGEWIRVTDPKSESDYRVRVIGRKRAISEGGS